MESLINRIDRTFDTHPDEMSDIDFMSSVFNDYPLCIHFSPTDYENNTNRYFRNLVYANSLYEIYAISWGPLSSSPIHDHAARGCVMKIVIGSLEETTYDPLTVRPMKTFLHTVDTNASFIHNKIALHSVRNPSSVSPALSIHLYSPPRHETRVFS